MKGKSNEFMWKNCHRILTGIWLNQQRTQNEREREKNQIREEGKEKGERVTNDKRNNKQVNN